MGQQQKEDSNHGLQACTKKSHQPCLRVYCWHIQVLQQMLSRKKMLASRSGSFTSMQASAVGAQ